MKKGFVLMETIVVITVLCVILIMLYASYSKILVNVSKKSLYDNTEYLYKASVVRDYLEDVIEQSSYQSSQIYMVCRNTISDIDSKCYDKTINNFKNDLFKMMGVESVYITIWNTDEIDATSITTFEATTQNYIKTMDPTDESGYRIIVMFKDQNNETDKDIYQYASLRFEGKV